MSCGLVSSSFHYPPPGLQVPGSRDRAPRWPWRTPQLDPAQTHKAGRVVIPHGLGVPEGLQQWVGTDDLVFQCPLEHVERLGAVRGEVIPIR